MESRTKEARGPNKFLCVQCSKKTLSDLRLNGKQMRSSSLQLFTSEGPYSQGKAFPIPLVLCLGSPLRTLSCLHSCTGLEECDPLQRVRSHTFLTWPAVSKPCAGFSTRMSKRQVLSSKYSETRRGGG